MIFIVFFLIIYDIIILVKNMITIKNNINNELIIKNSRFITLLYKINTLDEVEKYLNDSKNLYQKATHYCYAYIFNEHKKSSDDGEPGGTAGLPILNVLEKEKLNKVLVIVIRYFGGIKLGAGGLVRAYSKSVKEALNHSELLSLVPGKLIEIVFDYTQQKNLDYLLRDSIIIKQEFKEQIKYEVLIKNEDLNKIKTYNYKVMKEEFIPEKKDSI